MPITSEVPQTLPVQFLERLDQSFLIGLTEIPSHGALAETTTLVDQPSQQRANELRRRIRLHTGLGVHVGVGSELRSNLDSIVLEQEKLVPENQILDHRRHPFGSKALDSPR